MKRHPDLKAVFVAPLDKERAKAEDPRLFKEWFNLFHRIKEEHQVAWSDIYNMDEKGFLMGVVKKLKVVVPRHKKKKHMTQPGNRE